MATSALKPATTTVDATSAHDASAGGTRHRRTQFRTATPRLPSQRGSQSRTATRSRRSTMRLAPATARTGPCRTRPGPAPRSAVARRAGLAFTRGVYPRFWTRPLIGTRRGLSGCPGDAWDCRTGSPTGAGLTGTCRGCRHHRRHRSTRRFLWRVPPRGTWR
jgi:hypothetical protein